MKQPTFLEGAVLALIAAISGTVLFSALHLVVTRRYASCAC